MHAREAVQLLQQETPDFISPDPCLHTTAFCINHQQPGRFVITNASKLLVNAESG